jgi:hypothetical protein
VDAWQIAQLLASIARLGSFPTAPNKLTAQQAEHPRCEATDNPLIKIEDAVDLTFEAIG